VLTEINFGPEAISYIRSILADGKTLAKQLTNLPLESGHVYAYLPNDVSPEAARKFESGGIIPLADDSVAEIQGIKIVPVRTHELGIESYKRLLSFISKYLHGSNCYAVFEDDSATPYDPWILSYQGPFFMYGSEVYHFLTSHTRDTDTIAAVKSHAYSRLLIAVLTTVNGMPDIQIRENVTPQVLQVFADNTSHIIVSAYDGEGELIWSRYQP